MRFKLDENLPVEAAEVFRGAGYVGDTVGDEQLSGRPDPDLAAVCQREQRVLITLDLDFADIRVYPPGQYSGLIVMRPHSQGKPHVLALCNRLLPTLRQETVEKTLWIVDETGIRIRGENAAP
jgi:predicted nuclease of predicted toxin-antitoxin system